MPNYNKNKTRIIMPKVLLITEGSLPLLELTEKLKPNNWDLITLDQKQNLRDIDLIEEADFLLSFSGKIHDEILLNAKNIKLIQLCSAGFDGINKKITSDMNIPIANNGGANSIPVAEFTMTLMLSTIRHIVDADNNTRQGLWDSKLQSKKSYELFGSTVGIIGAGKIGTRVIEMLQGFNTNIIYTDIVTSTKAESLDAKKVSMEYLLENSDIVSLHVPHDKSTDKMINKKSLSLMKSSAIIINTCRGGVINEKDLYDHLFTQKIRGAGLDVFEEEPINKENPLINLKNVVLAPHFAGKSIESYPRRVNFAFENMKRVWDGEKPLSLV
ncbi:MAG: lactate dehydrogenase [Chloroflexi bacterium]|nr:lactate dehydrogenase [Chloroflexota bacterium]|tara:strand:+ start:379 stop:1362 length:984 start_codon:yes stop_codon:yes gene_type:complete